MASTDRPARLGAPRPLVRRLAACAAAAPLMLAGAAAAGAQTDGPAASDRPVERIRVLGGRAPGAQPEDRPLARLDREDLARGGQDDLADSLAWLSSAVGSEYNEDPGTQNDTSGTSSLNLRGLGLGATLILVNGQRQTETSVAADDGARFVDLNAIAPDIAVARVDVLKDGASPVYGSDAVAGVVDIITRDRFSGLELAAELRGPTEYDGAGAGHTLSAIAGRDLGPVHLVVAADFLDREPLEGFETDFVPGTGLSTLGQPGAWRPLADGAPAGPVIDRDCSAGGGTPLPTGAETAFGTPGFCQLDFGQFFSVLTDEERLRGFAAATIEGEATRLTLRATGADSLVERGNSPSLPLLTFPVVPAENPGNYFGADAVFFGRPFGTAAGAARRRFDHDTWRLAAELDHEASAFGRAWTLSLDAAMSRNRLEATITDTLAANFAAAIAGYGGPDCPADAAARGIAPGDAGAGCLWFNPFGSGAVVEDPGDPRFNPASVRDFIIGEDVRRSRADLVTVEAGAATPALFALPAGDVAAAFGVQTRRETLRVDHGEAFNADAFAFIIGGPDYSGARDAAAVFADARAPLGGGVELQLAARHEDVDGLASTDPRLALVWRGDAATLRASWATSFRAPSLHQQVSATTTLQSLAIGTSNLFRPVRTVGSPALEPETAETVSLGATAEFGPLTVRADVWRTEVEDLIVEESANAIIAADLEDGRFDDPRIEVSPEGEVTLVRAAFVNAPRVEARGLDLAVESRAIDLGPARLSLSGELAYIDAFTLFDPVLNREIDAEGSRNFTNFARSAPQVRARVAADIARGPFSARLALRHVGAYDDDENPGAEIDAWTAADVQARYAFEAAGSRAAVTLGALNLFDTAAPFVDTPLGYDTKVHDPRGRVAYLRLETRF